MKRIVRIVAKSRAKVMWHLRFKRWEGAVVGRDAIGLENVRFEGDNAVNRGCRFRGDVETGWRTTIGSGCAIEGQVSVGKYCMLGPETVIYSGNHTLTHLTTYTNKRLLGGLLGNYGKRDSVRIGHDVLTGRRALILPGVHVGNGAVIGAGAVVTKPVPPYAVVAGVPAAVVGQRIDDELIPLVESLSWWDKSDALLEEIRWLFEMDLVTEKDAALERLRRLK